MLKRDETLLTCRFAARGWKVNLLQKRLKPLRQRLLLRTFQSIARNAVWSCQQIIANSCARGVATICPVPIIIEIPLPVVAQIISLAWRVVWGLQKSEHLTFFYSCLLSIFKSFMAWVLSA
jgi:hypothetical protein